MGYKLIISSDAHDDINDITGYIAGELKSPQATAHFLDDVEASYRRIVDKPHIYSLCNDSRLLRMGYRKIVIKNYLILYRIDEDSTTVYVVRVVYGGRNYVEML